MFERIIQGIVGATVVGLLLWFVLFHLLPALAAAT